MKAISLILFVAFAVTNSSAQSIGDEIANSDTRLNKLILANNAAEAATFYAEDFLLTTSSGSRKTKKDIIAEISSPDLKIIINETQQVTVRVHGDAAVLTGVLHQKGTYKGKEFDVKLLVTDTWINTQGIWKILSGHASKAPDSIL